ncbi:protein FAM43A [Sphaerodactylus townsendi]|uniref:protein FAM43A n=1 Tax=Sphaerodactylus townsendi TaxID=933632 RepID=UPI0020266AA4|nr:protein FAM43A [Sphaerodactylus townsendi]
MRGRRPRLRRAPPPEAPLRPPGGEAMMLPWKRHKAAALAGGQEEPPGGAAASAGGRPASALGARRPASALGRLGRLLGGRRRRGTFRVSGEAPTFPALYLGNAPTLQAKGDGCTEAAVGRIWARSEAGRRGARMQLSVGPQGLRLAPLPADQEPQAAARPPGHLYLLHRLTYCAADPRLPRLFAWVYRHEGKHKAVLLRCHAALLPKAHQARALARLLYQTSAAALADFRRLKRRADARRQQQQQLQPAALPAPPLRHLLLRGPAGAAYKPPVERSRSAPRLGAISEDPRGEALEERSTDPRPPRRHSHDHEEEEEEEETTPGLDPLAAHLGQLAIRDPPAPRATRLPARSSQASPLHSQPPRPDGGPRSQRQPGDTG